MKEHLYSRGRDAARAARKAGHKDGEFEVFFIAAGSVDKKFGWRLLPVEPPEPKTKSNGNGSRASRFSFADINLSIGTVVFSTFDGKETATVLDDRHVTFRGERHTLSSAALVLAAESGRKWPRIQGPCYFTYQGRKLSDLIKDARTA